MATTKPKARPRMPSNAAREYVVWGLPAGSTDAIDARVLLSNGRSAQDVDRVKRAAGADGWHTFTVQTIDLAAPLDIRAAFAAAVKEAPDAH